MQLRSEWLSWCPLTRISKKSCTCGALRHAFEFGSQSMRLDCGMAMRAMIQQHATMPQANSTPGKSPAPAEKRTLICRQAVRTKLKAAEPTSVPRPDR
ncbi:hypothetical protein Q3P05_17050 [Ralstonia pseudosolanacearum]|nr:hypothetical protein [Ralstonia pseudosolanacearum]